MPIVLPGAVAPSTTPAAPGGASASANAVTLTNLYQDVGSEFTERCVLMEVFGDEDSGKSHFSLTAPGPIAYVHFMEKVGGLLPDAVANGKVVRQCKIGDVLRGDSKQVIELAEAAARRMELAISDAYGWARSIVVDTHTEAWQVVQLAKLGGLTPDTKDEDQVRKGQLVYAELNARWASIIKEFRLNADRDNRTNLIFIGRTKAEYKKVAGSNRAENTGRTVSAGHKEMPFDMDVRLRTSYRNGEYVATCVKPWSNDAMRGFEFTGEMLNFATVMAMITGTDEEEWR